RCGQGSAQDREDVGAPPRGPGGEPSADRIAEAFGPRRPGGRGGAGGSGAARGGGGRAHGRTGSWSRICSSSSSSKVSPSRAPRPTTSGADRGGGLAPRSRDRTPPSTRIT